MAVVEGGARMIEIPSESQAALDERYLRMALREAEKSAAEGEVPIGCVIVKDGRVVGRGCNRMETLRDPTAHAEVLAIGAACQALENWRLDGCTLYVTLEPCPMCAGAILNGRVARVVYGARDKRLGALGSTFDILGDNPINRAVEVEGPAMEEECLGMLKGFFRDLRARKKSSGEVLE
ncbi:MAG TPA: tRNA adenosine(34) deaminase TadA [Fibrobacteria bacterium]|jgi:tRNA(adenine34) deaminase|nr:tRNA adenosine(34) deaminase TadA [Fibrobacteria bacterium]